MNDTTAVVTGASRGLGAAVARLFARTGAHVVICARDTEPLESTASEIREQGGSVTAMRADVRDEFDIEHLMESASRDGAGIDIVVANAGVYHGTPGETPLTTESYAAFDNHLRTNGRGVFTTIRESIPHLADDARVLVSSGLVGRNAMAGYGSYGVSKATAEAIARGFATELDQPVTIVDPGQVATDLTNSCGREPADVAPMFHWVATAATPADIDGTVVDYKTWQQNSE